MRMRMFRRHRQERQNRGSCVNVQQITPIVVSKIENLVSLLSFAQDFVAFVDAMSLLDKNNNVTTGKLLDK